MHPHYQQANGLTHDVIGAGIEVHRALGPGLLESIYERCLMHELELRGRMVQRQERVSVRYKEITFEETLRFDLLVDGYPLIEVKCVQEVHPIHKAQLLSDMKSPCVMSRRSNCSLNSSAIPVTLTAFGADHGFVELTELA